MCGDYDSVIGMDKTVPIERFVKKIKGERLSVAGGEGTLCAVFVETDDASGLARRVAPVRLGGRLSETLPAYLARWAARPARTRQHSERSVYDLSLTAAAKLGRQPGRGGERQ